MILIQNPIKNKKINKLMWIDNKICALRKCYKYSDRDPKYEIKNENNSKNVS
jgi:hypothetical protein